MAARQGHWMWKICTITDEDPDSGHPNLLKITWMISWTWPGGSKNCFHKQIPTQILEESWKETQILFKFPTWSSKSWNEAKGFRLQLPPALRQFLPSPTVHLLKIESVIESTIHCRASDQAPNKPRFRGVTSLCTGVVPVCKLCQNVYILSIHITYPSV